MKFVVLCEYAEIVWGKKETNDIRERERKHVKQTLSKFKIQIM